MKDLMENLISQKIKEEFEGKKVNLEEILSNEFLVKFTDFTNVDEFILAYPTEEENPGITEQELDKWITEFSVFETYQEFVGKAGKDYIFTKLVGEDTMNRIRK